MPIHTENRHLPYTAQQIYDLVAHVEAYPQFLPWNSAARIRARRQMPDGRELIDADLVISFKLFRERFTSRVILDPQNRRIETEYLDGPFKYMRSHWHINTREDGCDIDFFVDFEFRNPLLQGIIGLVFNEAMQKIVGAFERRAQHLYSLG